METYFTVYCLLYSLGLLPHRHFMVMTLRVGSPSHWTCTRLFFGCIETTLNKLHDGKEVPFL